MVRSDWLVGGDVFPGQSEEGFHWLRGKIVCLGKGRLGWGNKVWSDCELASSNSVRRAKRLLEGFELLGLMSESA